MSNDTRKDRTKLQLRDAMIQLLGEKSFDQISTTELVKLAKVSRSSFYTHYQDKYDMIEAYQRRLFETIQYVFEKNRLRRKRIYSSAGAIDKYDTDINIG